MAITFHCDYCGKKIDAPDNAGGKWGKCPGCHNRLYVPKQNFDDEELKLAPIDEGDRERQKQLLAETCWLTQELLDEKEIPPESAEATAPPAEPDDQQLTAIIISYLRQMADGELDEAERIAGLIAEHRKTAVKILDKIASGEIPRPELADIPKQVLSELLKRLRTKIK
jgi:hypothetical protein